MPYITMTTIVLVFVLASACAPHMDAGSVAASDYGLLRVFMHDAPVSIDGHTITSVDVEVREVAIHGPNGWTTLTDTPVVYDLLQLVDGAATVLGDVALARGEYDQIRVILSDQHTITVDGERMPLRTPSAEQSGIKLNGPFIVGGGEILELTLDFDAARSLRWNPGNGWRLHPVIEIDGVVSRDGAFAAVQVSAAEGGTVALDDGASIDIPPGALTGDALITLERIHDQPSGFELSPIYDFGPAGTEFIMPASVTLPYLSASFPTGLPEDGIEMVADFERLGVQSQDLAAKTVTAAVTHFTTFLIVPTQPFDLLLSGEGLPLSVSDSCRVDGVQFYDHSRDSVPWVVAVVDTKRFDLRVRGIVSQDIADAGDVNDPTDDIYELQTLDEMVTDQGIDAVFAMNTIEFEEAIEGERGTPVRSLWIDGQERFREQGDQAIVGIEDNAAGNQTTGLSFSVNSSPLVADTVIGSATTVMNNGLFQDGFGRPHTWSPNRLWLWEPRTAVGVDTHDRLVFMVVGGVTHRPLPFVGGMTIEQVYHKLLDYHVRRAVLLDGGSSVQALFCGALKQLLSGTDAPAGGRKIIAGVVVEKLPRTPRIVDQSDAGFERHGPAQQWWQRSVGFEGDMIYTLNVQNASQMDNWGTWTHVVSEPGSYQVAAHVPSNYADTRSARYTISHADGSDTVQVDQSQCFDDWVDIGTYTFAAGAQQTVSLTDVTGELRFSRKVGFDAVRLTPADQAITLGCGSGISVGPVPPPIGDQSVLWRLPFPGGQSYVVTQGDGGHSYISDQRSVHAIDFGLGDGEIVVAAAGGSVVEAVDISAVGGCNSLYANTGNRVVLQHPDGTNSLYLHLEPNSIPPSVTPGAWVDLGDVIGKAGHTGYVCSSTGGTGAHLHFQRQSPGSWFTRSLPVYFEELAGQRAQTDQTYTSANY